MNQEKKDSEFEKSNYERKERKLDRLRKKPRILESGASFKHHSESPGFVLW
jgi:hypothetical protein